MSTKPTIDAEDPRLTAYALGELPKAERAEFESLLRANPALLKQVATIQRVAHLLEEDLKAEAVEAPPEPLTQEQRAKVERAAERPASGRAATKRAPSDRMKLARKQTLFLGMRPIVLAASVLVAGGLALGTMSTMYAAKERAYFAHAQAATEQAGGHGGGHVGATEVPRQPVTLAPGEVLYAPTTAPSPTEAPPSTRPQGDAYDANLAMIALEEGELAADKLDPGTKDANGVGGAPPATAARAGKGPAVGYGGIAPPVPAGPPEPRLSPPRVAENGFKPTTGESAESTFSIDVDTASYANVRRFLNHHQRPPADVVRIEEMINYFSYAYAPPTSGDPFAAHVEVTGCPWQPKHRLVRIGLKGRELDLAKRPAANLVFLIDVSGSMNEPQKLPLVKEALKALVKQTTERDRVSIVVYAGAAGLVLPPTSGDRHAQILEALERLQAGGSTNGGAGIELAYRVAIEGFKDGGINRVILCSDGDWNVGIAGDALQRLIEQKARSNVFLTVLGFGGSNFNDRLSETLADKGNGNYALIDDVREAKKVLVEQAAGTLVTIAKDVKVQVAWNPKAVKSYRLVGYENRVLANQDFRNDAKDAGEIGAGHTVTALYEIEPTGVASESVLTLRLRHKLPEGDVAKEQAFEAKDDGRSFDAASEDTRWSAAVAGFGMLLRDSEHKGQATWALVKELAQGAVGKDAEGRRAEMVGLIERAASLVR